MCSRQELRELDELLTALCNNLSKALEHNMIPPEWLENQEGDVESMLHSRVWAVLAKTGFDLDYVVEVSSGFKPIDARQFRPDIQLWRSDKLVFLIEYESTNSSDSRVLWKDLKHYVDSAGNSTFPDYWLVIYTLPDHRVDKWKSWDYRSTDPVVYQIRKNPHEYYKRFFEKPSPDYQNLNVVENIDNNPNWEKRKIVFINLSNKSLEIDFPKTLRKKYSFR